ncbi:MAG: hypothetical protein NTX88_09120, partial [Candidatus Atribacteria bacterium]|nr:hypothetical protein [Candidatus Atribacteria bacterium]
TDLPVGTRLVVTITVHSSTPVTLKRKIEVRKGVFTAFFTPSSQVPAGTTDFLVEAVCNPRQQSDGVGSLFDLNGENLVGPKVEKLGKVRIMKASQYMILE